MITADSYDKEMYLNNNFFFVLKHHHCEQLQGLARNALSAVHRRHEERNRLFCIADFWKSFNLFT